MEQIEFTIEKWDSPECRRLPLLNGAYQEVEGTRLLWHHYEDVLHYGAWSYRDLLDAVWDERDKTGCEFATALHTVIAYRSAEVRLWREALRDQHVESLATASRQFREAFIAAAAGAGQ